MQEVGSHAVLISRNGRQIDLEDSAAPIKDETDSTMGVVLVFRDVTDKNEQRKEIEYLSFHDALTGLYNRGYFNAELNRLNTERNLPISVVMGDVNGLKLTNDIFGHIFGDMLLVKAAENLKKACRRDDIVARWGGDEFVMLLPKTGTAETEKIVERIEAEFAKEQIKAINGSISMGFAVKLDMSESIEQVLNAAEEKMYAMKTLKRHVVNRNAMNAIDRLSLRAHFGIFFLADGGNPRQLQPAIRFLEALRVAYGPGGMPATCLPGTGPAVQPAARFF